MAPTKRPDGIPTFRLMTLQKAIELEAKGLRKRGPSALTIVKREYGLKGSRQRVLDQLEEMISLDIWRILDPDQPENRDAWRDLHRTGEAAGKRGRQVGELD
jgi:hypothetical protein